MTTSDNKSQTNNPDRLKATVFIPTYNGEKYIAEIITAVMGQKLDAPFELLIIDSGSKDKTLSIIKDFENKFDNIRVLQIPNSEFGHGKTRNYAAKLAKGEFIVFLSHDAIPATDTWLYEMLAPFLISEKIVAVMGKQIPRQFCNPMQKYEIESTFAQFGPDFGTSIFYKDSFIKDQAVFDAVRFYSDVNSAARRDFLVNSIPYRDVKYAEDQLFGEDLLEAGYSKAYAPRGVVVHSNDLTLRDYRKRMFDEILGLREGRANLNLPHSLLSISKLVTVGQLKDAIRILRDKRYGKKRKLYWIIVNPIFHIEKWRGIRAALLADLKDEKSLKSHSLEARNKL